MSDKIFKTNPKDLILVIDNLYSSMNNYNKEVINLISNFEKENINAYKEILERQGSKLKFNIFDIITDKWRRENFHSEILKFLLENCEDFFNDFLDLIEIKNKEEYSNAEITNEEAKIDILIKSEKKAIIVENKINWASDQNEQLARYYKKIKDEYKKEVEKIVYIAPSKDKEPDSKTFGKDEEIKKEIKDRYIEKIGFDGSENDLVSCLEKSRDKLKENLEKTKNNLDSENFHKLFFINHYIEILKRTGAGDMSTIKTNFTKEIIEKYKTDKDIFKKINYIGEMYNNLLEIKNKYILNYIKAEDWGYNKKEAYYSCGYTFPYGKNNFYLEIKTWDIFKIYIYFYDDKGKTNDIKNILSKALKKEDVDKMIKDGLELDFPDEEDKLFDLVIKLKKAFDEFCNS